MVGEVTPDMDGTIGDETCVPRSDPEATLRARTLSHYLKNGSALKDVRLVEDAGGYWTIWVRLTGRPGEYRLHKGRTDEPKVYRDVKFAIAFLRDDYRYFGPITLSTDRHSESPPLPSAKVAGNNGEARPS